MGKRLYVGNLPFNLTEGELRDIFSEAGDVMEVKLITDRETGRPRGFGFVEMVNSGAATQAIEMLNGRDVQGRSLNVKEAEERGGGGGGGGGGRRGGFGQARGGRW